MRTNPFYDSWLFLIGAQGDQTGLGAWRWLFVAFFVALLVGTVAIALYRMAEDPEQRSGQHLLRWLLRTLVGAMWFQGMLWKLPMFSNQNGLYYWTNEMVGHAAFPFYSEIVTGFLLPYFNLVNPLVFLAELAFAI